MKQVLPYVLIFLKVVERSFICNLVPFCCGTVSLGKFHDRFPIIRRQIRAEVWRRYTTTITYVALHLISSSSESVPQTDGPINFLENLRRIAHSQEENA